MLLYKPYSGKNFEGIQESPFNKGAVALATGGSQKGEPNYLPYNKNLIQKARELRNKATPEENKLWYQYLAKSQVRFMRQKIIDNYILDFYCPSKKIGIEIDGSQHYTEEGMKYDKIRTEVLETYKIRIIRFTNEQIRKNFIEVCEYIEAIVNNIRNRKQV